MTQQFFHLDSKGEIFNQLSTSTNHLPLILTNQNLNLSIGSTKTSQGLSDLIKSLADYYVSFQVIAFINPTTLIIKTTPGSYAILEAFNSIDSKVASLQYILSNIKIGETLPTKIDLRFDKPVLTY